MRSLFALTAFALMACAAPTFAQGTFYVNTSNNQLGTVDVNTGAYTEIGAYNVSIGDIAAAPDGSLYGIGTDLYVLNKQTGATTLIGSTGLVNSFNSLAYANGTLYAVGGDIGTGLYTINTTTGAATLIGDTGFYSSGDLEVDNLGDLYLSAFESNFDEHLVRLDPTTGAGTVIGDYGGNLSFVYGLAFDSDNNTLYGYGAEADNFVRIDRTTSIATPTATNQGPTVYGMTYIKAASSSGVPEPTSLAFLVLALPVIGTVRRRRS